MWRIKRNTVGWDSCLKHGGEKRSTALFQIKRTKLWCTVAKGVLMVGPRPCFHGESVPGTEGASLLWSTEHKLAFVHFGEGKKEETGQGKCEEKKERDDRIEKEGEKWQRKVSATHHGSRGLVGTFIARIGELRKESCRNRGEEGNCFRG